LVAKSRYRWSEKAGKKGDNTHSWEGKSQQQRLVHFPYSASARGREKDQGVFTLQKEGRGHKRWISRRGSAFLAVFVMGKGKVELIYGFAWEKKGRSGSAFRVKEERKRGRKVLEGHSIAGRNLLVEELCVDLGAEKRRKPHFILFCHR